MKTSRKIVIASGLFFVVFIASFGRAFPSLGLDTKKNENTKKEILISKEVFFRQTLNNCAPYSVMAVIEILKHKKMDPEKLASETTWRIHKNLTFPQGLIDLLHRYGIKTSEFNLYNYSEEERIQWLKNTIDTGRPIVLLVEVKHVKHYFTLIGYDSEGFMIYDSLQEKSKEDPKITVVDRPDYQGNRFYKNEEVMKLWDDGGFLFFFKNWAVVCE